MKFRFEFLILLLLTACATPTRLALPPAPDPLLSVDVPIYATSLIGTPYRWGGNSTAEGFDCSGLVAHVYAQVASIRLPRRSVDMSRIGVALEREHMAPGDLVFFNTQGSAYSHVGIYVGDSRFVHAASERSGILLSSLDQPYWRERYNGARRIAPD